MNFEVVFGAKDANCFSSFHIGRTAEGGTGLSGPVKSPGASKNKNGGQPGAETSSIGLRVISRARMAAGPIALAAKAG